jgi:hypothetical protein
MTSTSALLLAASFLSSVLAVAVLLRKQRSVANLCFFAGMALFAVEGLFRGIALEGTLPDALSGIGATVDRINHVIGRLSALRGKLDIKPVRSDLNQLIAEELDDLSLVPGVALVKALRSPAGNLRGQGTIAKCGHESSSQRAGRGW